jgi:hypothetical protein
MERRNEKKWQVGQELSDISIRQVSAEVVGNIVDIRDHIWYKQN